jgi:hypothetical protein
VIIIFGTPYAVSLFKKTSATIIVAYEDVLPTQAAVLDILQNKYKPTGILPVNLG